MGVLLTNPRRLLTPLVSRNTDSQRLVLTCLSHAEINSRTGASYCPLEEVPSAHTVTAPLHPRRKECFGS